ncbi:hypothetical protein [Hyphomicrobium sp.]|uniref:hypothetical protein n=1 Tax=Hyphomicrobium sp. TaxID=82 RepID=UPI002FE3DDC7
MNGIARLAPFRNHGHPIAERDQTLRAGSRVVLDANAATWKRMAMGKHKTHRPTRLQQWGHTGSAFIQSPARY